MSKEPLDPDEFEQQSEEIEVDSMRAVQYTGFDYNHDWKGFIGEGNQNSYDGWCTNRRRGDIPDDQPLHIDIDIYPEENRVVHKDNAGGMREQTFKEKYTNLNTPGEDKQQYTSGGDQGRGFHVLAQLGDVVQAETYNPHFRQGVEVRQNKRVARDFDDLTEYGTRIEILGCDPDEMANLADLDRVEEYIQSRFQRMLEQDEVTVEVTIHREGESNTRIIEPVDLTQFDVLYGPEDHTFDFRGDEYEIKDLIIYDRGGKDVPFHGIEMCKRNEYENTPYMRVKPYRPRNLKDVTKIFGFCDATSLKEFETGGHQDYKHDIHLETSIKDVVRQVLDEEFGSEPIDSEEYDDIREEARNLFQKNCELDIFQGQAETDLDTGLSAEDEETETNETTTEGDQTAEDEGEDDEAVDLSKWLDRHGEPKPKPEEEAETDGEEEDTPSLRCEVTEGREVEEGETVHIRPVVENPLDSGTEEVSVRGEIEDRESGTVYDLDNMVMEVPEGMEDSGVEWEFNPPSGVEGRMVFRGELYEKGGRTNTLDSTNTWFYVGESAPSGSPSGFPFKEILYTKRKGEEHRYHLNETDDGLVLYINALHPEFREATNQDGQSGTSNRAQVTFEYMMESAYRMVAENSIYEELGDVPAPDSEFESVADAVTSILNTEMDQRIDRALASLYQ